MCLQDECLKQLSWSLMGWLRTPGRLGLKLHAQLLVNAIGLLSVDLPALPAQQHMHAPVAEAHARLANLPYPLFQSGLPRPTGFVAIGSRIEPDHLAGPADRHLPIRPHPVDQRPFPGRPQSFRLVTSCSISLSSARSATIFFRRAFSCSSSLSRSSRMASGQHIFSSS